MFNRMTALGVGGVLLALLMAGCGGSGGDETSGGDASVAEVNATCLAHSKKVSSDIRRAYRVAIAAGLNSEKEEIRLETNVLVPTLIAESETQIAAVRSLEVPDGDQAKIKEILDAFHAWIEKAKATPFKVVVANDVYNEARGLAKKYGLVDCARSPFAELSSSAL